MAEFDVIATASSLLKQQALKLNEMLDKHHQDFSSLLKPKKFLDSYPSLLKEVGRRNAFNLFISDVVYKAIEEYNTVIVREQ